jgi:enediyne polyketide synthase
MNTQIAIVGMGCEYPDASTPEELWLNVLAQRRSFRRIPRERLDLEQYWSADRTEADLTYCNNAALLRNYQFNRVHFGISGRTFRATDLTHWLALDTAARAWRDAFFDDEPSDLRARTGVFVGNSLTGEFSRAATLRVRWPFIRDVIRRQLEEQGWRDGQLAEFLKRCEEDYKSHFEPLSEDTLPGSLSNTIAGRICNFFDFKGGGYVVDGACASSLLAVINGCSALLSRDLDVAVCGGVDLSIDPFELTGFARNGALATNEMRVFDSNPTGFLPGEGSGFVTLMRYEDAVDRMRPVHAIIRGWGISSDGKGGMTRPEAEGQLLALQRAYQRAALCPSSSALFEGHGTGTAAGDSAELHALRDALTGKANAAAAVGSIKANIGHTKAAAGLAGLLKVVMALKSRMIPPTTGCVSPHPIVANNSGPLRVQPKSSPWPSDRDLIAGVSAMGFGGINTHVVVQGDSSDRAPVWKSARVASESHQDAELFVFSEKTEADLGLVLERVAAIAAALSQGELSDLSANLVRAVRQEEWRAAVVATTPDELHMKLLKVRGWLQGGISNRLVFEEGVFLTREAHQLRICILFPGQGISLCNEDWPLYKRVVGAIPPNMPVVNSEQSGETERAQVGIALQCVKQLRILGALGIRAVSSVGYSLGELTALHWAGAIDETQLIELARLRGRLMHDVAQRSPRGAMLAVMASRAEVTNLLSKDVVIAALNGSHIVLSGSAEEIGEIERKCCHTDLRTLRVPVQYAFHSPTFSPAAQAFQQELNLYRFRRISGTVFSTVSGIRLPSDTKLASHLAQQMISPVLFENAVLQAARGCDLFLDLGSDGLLANMVAAVSQLPVVSWKPDSVKGILKLAGCLFASTSPVRLEDLAESRYYRKFSLEYPGDFLRSPCTRPNILPAGGATIVRASAGSVDQKLDSPPVYISAPPQARRGKVTEATDKLLQIISNKTELPLESLSPSMSLLTDLHLSSITVAQIAIEAAKSLDKNPLLMPTSVSTKTIGQLAAVLAESSSARHASEISPVIGGVDSWVGIAVVENQPAFPRAGGAATPMATGNWTIEGATSPKANAIANAVAEKLSGDGILLIWDANTSIDTALRTVQAVCRKPARFLVVCDTTAPPISAFIRSAVIEGALMSTTVLRIDFDREDVPQLITAESGNISHFEDIDFNGPQRCEKILRFLPPETVARRPFDPNDNLLVLGGGKGIAAECAFQMARKYGLSLALVGRSSQSSDKELNSNLTRLEKFGIPHRYWQADVTNPEQLVRTVSAIESEGRPITGILHAAGLNVPKALPSLTVADIEQCIQPKILPLDVLCGCLDFHKLKSFIAFGSIISRMGFHGEAHYAHANELMRDKIEHLAKSYSECRFLCLEWSVWSGLGMGERLARVDHLLRLGVVPLTPEMGVQSLFSALESNIPTSSVVVTSRIPSSPTLKIGRATLRPGRFLERTLVNYPEIELIVESDLALQKDLYLSDHKLDGYSLFPAVLGLEAMAQVASALFHGRAPTLLSDIRFAAPITVAEEGTTIRIAVLRRSGSTADITIRSSQTNFKMDHFRATCSLDSVTQPPAHQPAPEMHEVFKCEELYDSILFQRGRFQVIEGYIEACARKSSAVISPTEQPWFSQFLPQRLSLISPALMDAAMHSIQVCIPHKRLVPTGVDRITIYPSLTTSPPFICRANERCSDNEDFVYDVEITDQTGAALQRWDGLKLHSVGDIDLSSLRTPVLIANMLERRWNDISGDSVNIFLSVAASNGRIVGEVTGRRADGKPMTGANGEVRAWSEGMLLQCLSSCEASCDLERITNRDSQMWLDLLGESLFHSATFLARQQNEDLNLSATRVWCMAECLKKLGKTSTESLVVEERALDRWTISRFGDCVLGTVPITLSGFQTVAAFARQLASSGAIPVGVHHEVISV